MRRIPRGMLPRTLLETTLAMLLASSGSGCSNGLPSSKTPPVTPADRPVLNVPRLLQGDALLAPKAPAASRLPGLPAHGLRFLPVDLDGKRLYVAYVQPPGQSSFVPYYADYDPDFYVAPALESLDAAAPARSIRFARRMPEGAN